MQRKIFIDPGHGDQGGDFGAIASDGTREADVTLDIAKKLKNLLTGKKFQVYMSRERETNDLPIYNDNLGDLPYRVDRANKLKADLFVSIHCNAAVSEAAGTEIFYCSGSKEGQKLAKAILNEVLYLQKIKVEKNGELWDFPNRGIKTGRYYVITKTSMPAVLIETLFLTNPFDLKLLKTKKFRQFYAMAIANGIGKYFSKDKNNV